MTGFLIVAAALTAAALLFVLTPLLRKQAVAHPHASRDAVNLMVLRDQLSELDADLAAGSIDAQAYRNARQELERRVLEDVRPAAAAAADGGKRLTASLVGVALPLLAAALYYQLGNPAGLDAARVAAPKNAAHEVTTEQIENMVAGLARRLQSQPDDADGWGMLARSYNALGRFGDAAGAYARLLKLVPGNAEMLADYADTLAMSRGKSLQGEPEQLVERALQADPKNIKALALSGSAAYERRDYRAAVAQWKKVLEVVPADSEFARSTATSISEAQRLAGEPAASDGDGPAPAPAAAPAAAAAAAPSAAAEVAGTVELDPALRARVADTDTVFIFARAVQGPRFPLAVLRKQVKDLPAAFVLDDSMSMVPTSRLSNFPMVVVGARISKSGSASPAPGDFEGLTEPVRPGAKNLKIRIDSQRK